MDYKGNYDADTGYNPGDVVVYTDNVAYQAFKEAPAGIVCHDTHCWERLGQPYSDIVLMFHGILSGVDVANKVLFNENTLVLGVEGSEDKFAVTVDDTGETPELVVEEITNEGGDT